MPARIEQISSAAPLRSSAQRALLLASALLPPPCQARYTGRRRRHRALPTNAICLLLLVRSSGASAARTTCHRPGLLPPRWLELMFKNKGSASSHPWSSPCRAGWTEDCSSRVLSFSPSHRPSRPPDASTSLAVGSGPLLTVGHHPRPALHTIQLRPEQRRRATHASSGPPLSSFGSGVSHPRHKGESNRAGRRDGEGSSFAKFG
jgi:hypothetical protein